MRIFVGIKLDEAVRERISDELAPFKEIAATMHWTEKKNIHLTLKFIGAVAEKMLAGIVKALLQAKLDAVPFSLKISGFGKFPGGDELRVFWAGVEENPSLLSLFSGIESVLFSLGIARETRVFQPHITLARSKSSGNLKAFLHMLASRRDVFLAECPVTSFQLFSSQLTPAGPRYEILKEIPLGQS